MQLEVLFISPSTEDAGTLREMLGPLSVPLRHATNLRDAQTILERDHYGVVLTEAHLPDGEWESVVGYVEDRYPHSAVIVTHPFADARFWASALEMGAYDVLAQPFCCSEVQRILSNALFSPVELKRANHAAL